VVVAEAPPWVAFAIVAVVLALASTTLLASRRRGEMPWLSWLAFAFVVAIVVFMLGIIGISWVRGFFLAPGSA
jgi:hypothetical protein